MPWSPIPKFFEVLKEAREQGYEKEIPIEELKRLLMLRTGVINKTKLSRYLQVMQELKLIRMKTRNVAEILDTWNY